MSVVNEVNERKEIAPYVRFERVAVENKAETMKQGRYVAIDVDYALVTAPYSKDIFKQKAATWLSQMELDAQQGRINPEWVTKFKKQYDAWRNGQELPPDGTPILGWGVISPAQQQNLIRMNILTVETLAAINDEGQSRIGMGAVELKTKAKAWLSQLNDKGPLTMEIAATKAENAQLSIKVETLQKQVEALMTAVKVNREVPHETPAEQITASDLIEDDDIVAQYTAKFGQAPHHKMKPETIRERLKG